MFSNKGALWALPLGPEIKRNAPFIIFFKGYMYILNVFFHGSIEWYNVETRVHSTNILTGKHESELRHVHAFHDNPFPLKILPLACFPVEIFINDNSQEF